MTPSTTALRALLLANGFTEQAGEAGPVLVKSLRAGQMPYVQAHIVNNETICNSDTVVLTVTPDDMVRMHIEDTDYVEEQVPLLSDEAHGLFEDAGISLTKAPRPAVLTAMRLEERLTALEAKMPHPTLPGTALQRVMHETSGVQWCLAVGTMCMPKTFFRGPTIEDVVAQAEAAVAATQGGRLATEADHLAEVFTACAETAPPQR